MQLNKYEQPFQKWLVVLLYFWLIRKQPLFMGIWKQVAEYLFIKKRDPEAPRSTWIKYMHGINRISIFMFLLALVILLLKLFVFKKH